MDYRVDVTLINCLAMNFGGTHGTNSSPKEYPGTYFGHWVEKGPNYFIIYVAFVADDNNNWVSAGFPAPGTDGVSQRDGGRYSGFIVPVSDILTSNTAAIATINKGGYVGNPRVGKCTYPTVMWNMTGVPDTDAAYLHGNLNGTNPEIYLKDI